MWKCALLKKSKIYRKELYVDFLWNSAKKIKQIFSWYNWMTKLCLTMFKYENKMEMGWYNWLKTAWFTQMRWRIEKGDVLVWTMSVIISPFLYGLTISPA